MFLRRDTQKIPMVWIRTMTRDGGQKLELRNRLINSFYGSSFNEINENWQNFLD